MRNLSQVNPDYAQASAIQVAGASEQNLYIDGDKISR